MRRDYCPDPSVARDAIAACPAAVAASLDFFLSASIIYVSIGNILGR